MMLLSKNKKRTIERINVQSILLSHHSIAFNDAISVRNFLCKALDDFAVAGEAYFEFHEAYKAKIKSIIEDFIFVLNFGGRRKDVKDLLKGEVIGISIYLTSEDECVFKAKTSLTDSSFIISDDEIATRCEVAARLLSEGLIDFCNFTHNSLTKLVGVINKQEVQVA